MNAVQLAALVAAVFFAVGVCAAVFVLVRLGRLISLAGGMLTDYRDRTDALIDRAQAAVDRSHEQLSRTDAITASMDEVSSNMAELSGQVSALAGLARGISAGLGTPLTRLAALAYGIRRAAALHGAAEARAAAAGRQPVLPGQRAALAGGGEGAAVIRRLFWMSVGAAAGVTGYRRVSRLARAIQPQVRDRRRSGGRRGYAGLAVFLGDVREGMELYMHRRSAPSGPTLEGQHVLADGRDQPAASRGYPGTNYAKDGR